MNPVTIVSASAGLLRLCANIGAQIFTFIRKARTVDDAIVTLRLEVDSLSQAISSIKQSFDDPLLTATVLNSQARHERRHWQNVQRAMTDGERTLNRLNTILESVTQCEGQFLVNATRQIRLDTKSGEILLLKEQIASCRMMLQLSLQLITVYVHCSCTR
jgi:hypothetical protein